MKKASRIILALILLPLLLPLVQAGTNFVGGAFNLGQVNGTTATTGAGASGAGTLRVILASDSPAGSVSNSGTFAVQNTAATPVGGNNIGTVSGSTVSVSGMPKCGGVPVQTAVGCTTSSGQLVAGNANRCGIEVESDAAPDNTDKVFVNWGSVAATNAMKRLEVGGSWQPPVISTVAVQCLAKSGTQNLRVIEYNYQ